MDDATVQAAFEGRRAVYRAAGWAALAAVLAALALLLTRAHARFGLSDSAVRYALLGAVALRGVAYLAVWRCPRCNALLGRADDVSVCGRCGACLKAAASDRPPPSPSVAVFREYEARVRRQRAIVLGGLGAFGAVMAARMAGPARPFGLPVEAWLVAFGAVVAATGLAMWRNWRCPSCDRYWGRNVDMLRCPYCGVELA